LTGSPAPAVELVEDGLPPVDGVELAPPEHAASAKDRRVSMKRNFLSMMVVLIY
jgi:hypothetical protein